VQIDAGGEPYALHKSRGGRVAGILYNMQRASAALFPSVKPTLCDGLSDNITYVFQRPRQCIALPSGRACSTVGRLPLVGSQIGWRMLCLRNSLAIPSTLISAALARLLSSHSHGRRSLCLNHSILGLVVPVLRQRASPAEWGSPTSRYVHKSLYNPFHCLFTVGDNWNRLARGAGSSWSYG
jgi:hypothetical protein